MGNACYGYDLHPVHYKYDELSPSHIFRPINSDLWRKQSTPIPGPLPRKWRSSWFMAMPCMPTC
eukprot:13974294-Ditylum_brightwellii.AAC.1